MKPEIDDRTRDQIARFLPDALAKALASYQQFIRWDDDPETAKQFNDHHNACKVAIAHIELLLKLATAVNLPDPKAQNGHAQIALANLMQEVNEEVKAQEKRKRVKSEDD